MLLRRTKEESVLFASDPGKRFYVEKHGEVLPNGVIRLVPDKEIDLQEKYNAEYPATTIDNILANSSPLQSFADDGVHGLDATQLPGLLPSFSRCRLIESVSLTGCRLRSSRSFLTTFRSTWQLLVLKNGLTSLELIFGLLLLIRKSSLPPFPLNPNLHFIFGEKPKLL